MKRLLTLLFAVLAVIAMAIPAGAKSSDWEVGCKNADFDTIQLAIDSASVVDGDTIRVCAGTYFGAVIDKAVNLEARGDVVINDGPNLLAVRTWLRIGFLFNNPDLTDWGGSGAEIKGFRFEGVQSFAMADDGKLDMAVYSYGANNVTVAHNTMSNFYQAITSWNGSDWKIEHNEITNLWALSGGGIGIFVGGRDHQPHNGNTISHNSITGVVSSAATGGYTGAGIALSADFRYGQLGTPALTDNLIEHNQISIQNTGPIGVHGIELSVLAYSDPVVTRNVISHNNLEGITGVGIYVGTAAGNLLEHNNVKHSVLDLQDLTTGGSGTGITDNEWNKNNCDTSDPEGLCK